MKAVFNYTAILLGAIFLASCNPDSLDHPYRYKESDGVPFIHFVRYADRDVMIREAGMNEVVCIVGDKLNSVHEIYFNDQKAELNTSYMTPHTIVVAVPGSMPAMKDNMMHLITRNGTEVLYDFTVLTP